MLHQILIHHSDSFLTNSSIQWISKASPKSEDMKKTHLACYGKSNITLHRKVFLLKSLSEHNGEKTERAFQQFLMPFQYVNDFACLNTEFLTTT